MERNNHAIWILNGFRSYPLKESTSLINGADCLLQKRIDSNNRCYKYCINVYPFFREGGYIYMTELQFHRRNDIIDVTLHRTKSPTHALDFAEEVWTKLIVGVIP